MLMYEKNNKFYIVFSGIKSDPALKDARLGGTFVAEAYESVPTVVDAMSGFVVRKKKEIA